MEGVIYVETHTLPLHSALSTRKYHIQIEYYKLYNKSQFSIMWITDAK